MKVDIDFRRAMIFALLSLFLTLNLMAQVSIHSPLYEERNVKLGETYQIEVVVYNPTENPVEILIIQKDYQFKNNQHHFFNPGKMERSNAEWIKVEHPRLLLPAQRKTTLIFPITVPEDAVVGSYHSILGIQTRAAELIRGNANVGLNYQYNVQIVSNVNSEQAEKKLKVTKVEVKDDRLFLTIRNVGEQILTFSVVPPIPGIQADKKARIYPDMERTIELDISDLSDGEYKELRFLLDNGKDFIQPVFISFDKGVIPTKAELYVLRGERLREQRKRRPTFLPRVYAVLTYGSNFKSASLSGSMNLFKNLISLSGGSNYREFNNFISNEMLTHRVGTSLNLRNFRASYNAYFFENSVFENASVSYSYKNFRTNINYVFDRKILQGSVSQKLWKGWNLSFYGFYDSESNRKRYSLSLMIPII